ncbi:MAG: hypothetical protein KJN66_03705 [Bacteroidia bacterium]|nr:hypothetical protein [Bacteroidia bacterium]
MKKKIINFISTIIIALILSQFLPWWSVMLAAFITGLFISLKKIAVFYIPFLAIAVFWMVYAFLLSSSNDFIMAKKIATLLPLKGNPYLLLLVTGLIGGIAGGMGGILGNRFKKLFT